MTGVFVMPLHSAAGRLDSSAAPNDGGWALLSFHYIIYIVTLAFSQFLTKHANAYFAISPVISINATVLFLIISTVARSRAKWRNQGVAAPSTAWISIVCGL